MDDNSGDGDADEVRWPWKYGESGGDTIFTACWLTDLLCCIWFSCLNFVSFCRNRETDAAYVAVFLSQKLALPEKDTCFVRCDIALRIAQITADNN